MTDIEKKWIKYIVLALLLGFIAGRFMMWLLGLILSPKWTLVVNLMVPVFMIISLLFVGFLYEKEKEKTIG